MPFQMPNQRNKSKLYSVSAASKQPKCKFNVKTIASCAINATFEHLYQANWSNASSPLKSCTYCSRLRYGWNRIRQQSCNIQNTYMHIASSSSSLSVSVAIKTWFLMLLALICKIKYTWPLVRWDILWHIRSRNETWVVHHLNHGCSSYVSNLIF